MLNRFLLIIGLFIQSLTLNAATYYVSSTGNDSNNGTSINTPWQTITKVNQANLQTGDKVLFQRGGIFRGKITAYVNGVTYDAYGGGNNPIIAASRVATNWTQHNGNIWKTTITAPVTNLFCNNVLMTLARYPNTGWLRNNNGSNTHLTSTQLTQPSGYWTGTQAVIRSTTWSYDVPTINSYTTGTLNFNSLANGDASYNLQNYTWGFFMQNKLSELDVAGEWFYDTQSSQLYFWSPNNANPNTLTIDVMGANTSGQSGILIGWLKTGIRIKNLDIRYGSYAGIENSGGYDLIIDSCKITNNYIGIKSYTNLTSGLNNIIVKHTIINNNFESGVNSVGVGHTFEDNELLHNAIYPGLGNSGWGYITMDTYSNNTIIRRNRIIGSGYIGVAVRGNSLVERNFIDSSCTILNDGCGMGPDQSDGAIFRENIILNTIGNTESCASNWSGCDPKGKGIYFGNLAVKNTIIENNTVAYCNGAGMWVDHTMASIGNTIQGNTFFDNDLYQIGFSDFSNYSGPAAVPPYAVASYNQTITNNIFYCKNASQRTMYHINRWYSGIDFGTFTNNKHHNPWNQTIIQRLNFINGTDLSYTLTQWQNLVNDEVGSTISQFNLTGNNGINDHILIYNNQYIAQNIPIPSGTWSDLSGNQYTNSVYLDIFRSKVLYKVTSSPTYPPPAASPARDASLLVEASVSSNPPSITVKWSSYVTATNYSVFRKLKTATSWGSSIASLSGTANQYIDNTINLNTYYEYKVVRTSSSGTAIGYVATGIQLNPIEYRGKLILVIDNTFTTSLSSELTQLQNDLKLDGWSVSVITVARNSSASNLKSLIQNTYNLDPTNTKMLLLVGHVPVYMSGNISPDGHTSIPWACDSYYGDMNGSWSTPPTTLPSDLELQVGRIDLYNMPAFSQTETQLMQNYLVKLHNFKVKQFTPPTRMLMQDNFTYNSSPLAESGYRTSGPLVGINGLDVIPTYSYQFWTQIVNDYLWTYSSGGGSYNSADGVGTTSNYASSPHNGIFNMTFGSYFGNWDANVAVPNWNNGANNFLRAPLASGKALTNVWAAQPAWFFHHMGMGDPIGYSTLTTINNRTSGATYQPQNTGWLGQGYTTIHLGLMGDPSLRMNYVSPPTNLSIINNGTTLTFNWNASSEQVDGYNLYVINQNGIQTKVNTSLITTNTITGSFASTPGLEYMVRALKLQVTSSGTYNNLSLGTSSVVPQSTFITLNCNILLQGPYKNGLMIDSLRTKNLLPLIDPYPSLGYIHTLGGGQTINPSILLVTGNSAIVDWVIVELRSSTTPSTILYSRSGLLQRDGDIVDTDGISPLTFNMSAGQYYVVIKHRNHLGVMTATPYNLTTTPITINFNNIPTFGTNAMISVGGVKMMWAGDTNFDGVIKYSGTANDRDPILFNIGGAIPTNVTIGYSSEDVNLDGIVKYTGQNNDRDPILFNIGGNIPTNTKLAQLP